MMDQPDEQDMRSEATKRAEHVFTRAEILDALASARAELSVAGASSGAYQVIDALVRGFR